MQCTGGTGRSSGVSRPGGETPAEAPTRVCAQGDVQLGIPDRLPSGGRAALHPGSPAVGGEHTGCKQPIPELLVCEFRKNKQLCGDGPFPPRAGRMSLTRQRRSVTGSEEPGACPAPGGGGHLASHTRSSPTPEPRSLLVPGASCLCPGLPSHCVCPSLCGRLCWSHLHGHVRTLLQSSPSILAWGAWLRGGPATRHRAGYLC